SSLSFQHLLLHVMFVPLARLPLMLRLHFPRVCWGEAFARECFALTPTIADRQRCHQSPATGHQPSSISASRCGMHHRQSACHRHQIRAAVPSRKFWRAGATDSPRSFVLGPWSFVAERGEAFRPSPTVHRQAGVQSRVLCYTGGMPSEMLADVAVDAFAGAN